MLHTEAWGRLATLLCHIYNIFYIHDDNDDQQKNDFDDDHPDDSDDPDDENEVVDKSREGGSIGDGCAIAKNCS